MSLASRIDALASRVATEFKSIRTALAGKEPTITAGTTAQYWRGDKTWQTLPTGGGGTNSSGVSATELSSPPATPAAGTSVIYPLGGDWFRLNSDGVPTRIDTGARLAGWQTYIYGNSYGVLAAGWFTAGKHYAQLAAQALGGGTVTSYAVGGRRMIDVCATLINGTDFPGTTSVQAAGKWTSTSARPGLVVFESIINDIAHYPNMGTAVPTAITTANNNYLTGLAAMIRTALAIASSESRIEQTAATYGGTWVNQAFASLSSSGSSVAYATVVGASVTFTVTPPQTGPMAGISHFLTYVLGPSVGASVSKVTVSVDGGPAYPMILPPWEEYVGNSGSNVYQIPECIPVSMPIDGAAHTVKITHAGVAGEILYADCMVIPSVDPNPIVMMGAEHSLNVGAFTQAQINAYNTNLPRVLEMVRAVTSEFPHAIYVPSNITSGGLYSGDGLHPNDRGMAQRAAALVEAVRPYKSRLEGRVLAARSNASFAII